ncbi:MAG TPA: hypothetical protein VHW00_16780 [Thermoanaerobaculia bacterium]|nr:hypothetical protein [Thermoanaerobaculia bacterium]
MKRLVLIALILVSFLPYAPIAEAARVRVKTRRGNVVRVRVNTRPGFPIRRTMPTVVVRGPVVRVAPRAYLAPVAFTAVALATIPPARARVWEASETLDREDGWTDFTLDVDRRGTKLLLDIDGEAQVSFAEVVFDNGEAQVVDFNDRVHKRGTYELLDFRNGRKVDHVRIVAKADRQNTDINVYLVQ